MKYLQEKYALSKQGAGGSFQGNPLFCAGLHQPDAPGGAAGLRAERLPCAAAGAGTGKRQRGSIHRRWDRHSGADFHSALPAVHRDLHGNLRRKRAPPHYAGGKAADAAAALLPQSSLLSLLRVSPSAPTKAARTNCLPDPASASTISETSSSIIIVSSRTNAICLGADGRRKFAVSARSF